MKMKRRPIQISIFFCTLLISGCFDAPPLPDQPYIEFKSLKFIDYTSSLVGDSMLLKFEFEDGDGNIGLPLNYSKEPFHAFNVVVDSENTIVTLSDTSVVPPFYLKAFLTDGEIRLSDLRYFFDSTDNRPEFNDCDYYVGDQYPNLLVDTTYIQKNESFNNFHIEFLKKTNGDYNLINFSEEFNDCISLDGRIPIFDSENNGKPLTGTITYRLYSKGFGVVLKADTFKVRFYLVDFQLNRSNTAESPDLTLPDITIQKD